MKNICKRETNQKSQYIKYSEKIKNPLTFLKCRLLVKPQRGERNQRMHSKEKVKILSKNNNTKSKGVNTSLKYPILTVVPMCYFILPSFKNKCILGYI